MSSLERVNREWLFTVSHHIKSKEREKKLVQQGGAN